MTLLELKTTVRRMLSVLQSPEQKEAKKFYSFSFSRAGSVDAQMQFLLRSLEGQAWNLLSYGSVVGNRKVIQDILLLAEKVSTLYAEKKPLELKEALVSLESKLGQISEDALNISVPSRIPLMIKKEIEEDILELRRCFQSGCYRSTVILCGRILEACLHRKYYEVTGVDILEKNPGIGLGTLIAKLVEKGVKFDPGLTQQIHLINQVRIFSVHKKHTTFSPSRAQASAIILYTLDALEKMF